MSCVTPERAERGHRADRRRVAGAPDIERIVEHQSAAQEFADEEIEKIALAPRLAEKIFGRAGGGCIVADGDCHSRKRG